MCGPSRDSFSVFHFHIIGYSSKPMITLWAEYYPAAQFEIEDSFRGPYIEPVVVQSEDHAAHWGSVTGCTFQTGAKHPGCQVHRSTKCRQWLVWNQGLAITPRLVTKGQSTKVDNIGRSPASSQLSWNNFRHEDFRKTCCEAHGYLQAISRGVQAG